jgi:adenosylmethionine-8-amino-7-oxononanoate aminotransferase
VSLYKSVYQPLLMDVITVPSPDCYLREPGEDWETHSRRMFAHMEEALGRHADEVAAVIVEPLVQCAGGMRMYHPAYLEMLREACDRHGVHLIADEVAVGFGRTGTMFACEQAGIRPDFICLSKGLTGGYLPLSVVVTTDDVYGAFYDDYTKLSAFLHSHSYTGNALACAAALATLDIFEQDRVIERNRPLADRLSAAAAPLVEHANVAEIRQTGMILAIELVRDRATGAAFDWRERRGLRLYEYALSQGVLLRPLGPVVYWMPPYVLDDDEVRLLASVTARGIDLACE